MPPGSITPVILCGGAGSRLWPRSRLTAPKPFLPLVGTNTLFEEALIRCRDSGFGKPLIVTGAAHVEHVERLIAGFDVREIIVEPQPAQTAAAVAAAALRLPHDAVMLVCPSDHHIRSSDAFTDACLRAAELAEQGMLACLAVEAKGPETRFGYIRAGEPLGRGAFRVAQFVEKPDPATAASYFHSGRFAWNSGIFGFRAADYLQELHAFQPRLLEALREAISAGRCDFAQFYPDSSTYGCIKGDSIDRAVMEMSSRAAMIVAEIDWSDLGDWRSLKQIREKDECGNSVSGPAELVDCRNILVDTDGPKVRAIGLEDVIIVVDGDDILVTSSRA